MSCDLTMMLLLLVTKVLKELTKLSDKNIFGILCTQIFKLMLNHVLNVKGAKWISMQGNLLYIPFLLKRDVYAMMQKYYFVFYPYIFTRSQNKGKRVPLACKSFVLALTGSSDNKRNTSAKIIYEPIPSYDGFSFVVVLSHSCVV